MVKQSCHPERHKGTRALKPREGEGSTEKVGGKSPLGVRHPYPRESKPYFVEEGTTVGRTYPRSGPLTTNLSVWHPKTLPVVDFDPPLLLPSSPIHQSILHQIEPGNPVRIKPSFFSPRKKINTLVELLSDARYGVRGCYSKFQS